MHRGKRRLALLLLFTSIQLNVAFQQHCFLQSLAHFSSFKSSCIGRIRMVSKRRGAIKHAMQAQDQSGTTQPKQTQQKIPRRRAQSTTFNIQELTTDDNLSVAGTGEFLRNARGNWVDDILSTGRSRVLARISERLAFVCLWSTYISLVFYIAPPEWGISKAFEVPGWPHELVGGFLAILLVFRTDQAYQRFWEGRTKWADAAGQCKALARFAVAYLEGRQLDEVLAHISAFPVSLKQHLRGQRNVRELETVFGHFGLLDRTAENLAAANNIPLTLLTSLSLRLRALTSLNTPVMVANTREESQLELWGRMEDCITQLSVIVSACEQIKCTPIPLSYSRHTSRFFTLFSVTLPFALVPSTNLFLVPLIVTGISWVLFATEEIGHVIEEPFGQGLNDYEEMPVDEERLREVFDFFDLDNSGSIDKTEFFLALQKLGIPTPVKDVDRLVAEIDVNGNSLVEFDEFKALLARTWDAKKADAGPHRRSLSQNLGYVLVESIEGFYMVVSMILGIPDEQQGKQRQRQLEVLPLARYCDSIQKDILQQAIFTSRGSEAQQRYVSIAAKLSSGGNREWIDEIIS